MQIENRRIAQNTLVLYIRMLFVMGVSLYTSRVVLAELGVVDYGIYNVVGSVVTVFTFISQALGNATNRFIVFSIGKDSTGRTQQVFNTCYRVHLVIAFCVILLLETVGLWFLNGRLNIPEERYPAALWTFHFSVLVCFLTIIRIPYNAEIIAHENMRVFAIISIAETLLKLVVAISLAYSSIDKLILYAFLFFVVQLMAYLSYHIYCQNHYVESKLSWEINNDKRLYKDVGKFAGWSMLGNIVWLGYTQGVNLMLNMFFGPVVNAARGITTQVEAAVSSFVSSFQTALNPQITKSYAQHDITRMHSLIVYSSKFSFYLYLLIAVPLFFQVDNILGVWLVKTPDHATNFIRLTLVLLLLTPIANPLGISNDATGNIKKFQITCSLINLQIIIFSFIYLRLGYGPEIVYFVQIVVWTIQTIAKFLLVRKQIGLSFRYYYHFVIIPVFMVSVASVVVSYLLEQLFSNSIIQIVLFMTISFFSVLAVEYFIGLTVSEREIVNSTVRQKLKRFI